MVFIVFNSGHLLGFPLVTLLGFHGVVKSHAIYLGKFDHDLTVLPNPGIMVHFREIISKWP